MVWGDLLLVFVPLELEAGPQALTFAEFVVGRDVVVDLCLAFWLSCHGAHAVWRLSGSGKLLKELENA